MTDLIKETYSLRKEFNMNTHRLLKLMIFLVLAFTAFGALQAFRPSAKLNHTTAAYTGMGDLRRFESQQAVSVPVAPGIGITYTGMGDLRRFESQQAVSVPVAPGKGISYTGMGDLQRFEFEQESHTS
jgi:hypothetical protein